MPTARVNGIVIAKSDDTIVVEGNHYFPPDSIQCEYLVESTLTTACPWKGRASYYDVVVDGTRLGSVAWYYPDPAPRAAALGIAHHVAFYANQVDIED